MKNPTPETENLIHLETIEGPTRGQWDETTDKTQYLLNTDTGEVTKRELQDLDSMYRPKNSYTDKEISREPVPTEKIPKDIRTKVQKIMGEIPIAITSSTRDTGFRETTTFRNYYFNPKTREVKLVMTESNENTFGGKKKDYSHLELSKRTLSPKEIPQEVRKKIEEIVGPLT